MRTLLAVLVLAIVVPTSAAVARQAFQLNCSPIIGWRCPACGVTNATESTSGLQAICRRCSTSVEWAEIEPANEDALPFTD